MMDLGLDIFRTTGRAAKVLEATVVRELEMADLALLADERGTKAAPLKRLSQRHHALARNLAAGMKVGDAAAIVGYDISRVSILQADPAFKELVEFYKDTVDATYATLHEKLAGLSVEAAELIHQRLEDEGEKVPLSTLIEVTKMSADRTGFGPATKSTQVNINVNLADRLEAARKRVADRQKTLELSVEAAE